jgi:hypothetical protein
LNFPQKKNARRKKREDLSPPRRRRPPARFSLSLPPAHAKNPKTPSTTPPPKKPTAAVATATTPAYRPTDDSHAAAAAQLLAANEAEQQLLSSAGGHGRALQGVTALPVPAMPKIDYASFLKGWSSSADWKALGMPSIGDVVTLLGWDKLDWNQILGDVAAAAPEQADLIGGSLEKFLAFWGVNAELPAGPQLPRWTDLFKVNPATGKPAVDLNKIVANLAAKKNGTASGVVDGNKFTLGGLFDAAVNATQGRSATLEIPTFKEIVAALPKNGNATLPGGKEGGNGTAGAGAGLAAALQGAAGQMPPLSQVVQDLKKTAGALGKVTAALGVEPVKVEGLPSMAQVINGLDALDKVLKKAPKKEELKGLLQQAGLKQQGAAAQQ